MPPFPQATAICAIRPYLYVGNITAAATREVLEKHRIKLIVTVNLYDELSEELYCELSIKRIKFFIPDGRFDDKDQKILKEIFPAIQNCESKQEAVLVHCWMGKSRSVSLIISYLVWRGLTLREAYRLIRNKYSPMSPRIFTLLSFLKHTGGYYSKKDLLFLMGQQLKAITSEIMKIIGLGGH